MKKIYALFMMLCLVLSTTAAPLVGSVKKSYPLYPQEVVKAKLSLETSMQKAPAATQGLQYDATIGALVRYYNETDVMEVNTDYIANGQVYIDVMAADYSDYLSLLLFVENLEDGKIPAGTYPISSEPAYGTAYASQGYDANQGVIPCAYYPLVMQGGKLYISTPMYFMVSGSVTVEYVGEDLKLTIDAVNSNDIAINVVYEVGGKSEKVAVKTPLQYDATEGALDVTYGADATVKITDKGYYGTMQVSAPDASSMLALLFVYPDGVADAETTIPTGTYTINNSQSAGTVLASTGVSSSGSVGYSFYANLNASGQLVTPLYFLSDGTVEVTAVDGQIKVEVNATNSNDVPVHVVYNTIPEVVEPCTEAVAVNWDEAIAFEPNTDAWYVVNLTGAIEAGEDIQLTLTNTSEEVAVITVAAYENCPELEPVAEVTKTLQPNETLSGVAKYAEWLATQVSEMYLHVTTNGAAIELSAEPAPAEPVYEVMELTMTNLSVDNYGSATGLWASDMDNGIEVMLFLDAEGNLMEESSIMVGWMDYPVTGTVEVSYSEELATDVYYAELYTTVEDVNYKLLVTMYNVPVEPTVLVVENATIDDQTETSGFMYMNGEAEVDGVVYPVSAEVPGFDATVAEAVYEYVSVTVGGWGEDDPWLGFVQGDATVTVVDNVVTLTGVMSSWSGLVLDVTISGTLPGAVVDPVKPEPTYTENKLNTYAFGLESVVEENALVVTYRLNNSNATSVNVLVYNGEEVVATVAGTTTIGVNTVEVATAELPTGVQLTWAVEVNGTSVEAPTREEKIYSFYHPSSVDVDNNPENATFGMLLVNEGMQKVKNVAGYESSSFGAGIFAYTPSFDLIPNGELPGYNGGVEFTETRADGTGTAYAPRRIRISEDGRIFVTSLNTDGNYLWEVNAADMNEWTPVFQGALNDQRELVDAEGNFVAAPNNGFDVKGSGENLQLAMYSVNLSGITAAAMGGFRLHEYNLGTATEWTTAPSKAWVEGLYAINYTGTQVEYDNEGGLWIASYRGSATDANPGLVHINAEGVEDAKLVWNNVRQAGIRFNNDFTKLVVAGNNGAAKKATIYAVSKDENGAPVLTEETVVDMSAVGNNLNDFAWDYAGNLYSCGNSAEKLAAWAMPYSGQVVTPAASKYAFELVETVEMVGVVKRVLYNGYDVVVLTHEEDGTAHIYNIVEGDVLEVSQEGVIAVDAENAGDYLAISDIALTEDGKLVATNYMQTQAGDSYVNEGYKRGETRIYMWDDLAGAPSILFTSKMSSNWFRSKQGLTMAVKGTSDNMEIFMTGIHATSAWARVSSYRVIDGVYEEPAVNHNDYYYFYDVADAVALETTVGTQYELNASPLGDMNWILDANLIDPVEIVEPETNNVEIASCVALNEDLGKKYNGASYITVNGTVYMVAPFATPAGDLVAVEILDITNGLDAAQYVDMLYLDEAVAATAAATAVTVVENTLVISLVADATLYSFELPLGNDGDDWQLYEDAITNLVIDYDNMLLIGGPSEAFQVEVVLGLGDYDRNTDNFALLPESSISVMGSEATFVEGYASVDGIAQTALAVVRCMWNGMALEFHLTMSAAALEATVVVVENAAIEIEKYLIWGDMYDYALKMTGNWINEEDGLTYPVLVEVPVYYPESTDAYEIYSTVTVGGWGDEDPWLGFGEGYLTITEVDNVITATGVVENPMAGVAIDITISGTKVGTSVENATVTVKAVKAIKNGQLIIEKNGVQYNAQGAKL